MKKTEKIKRIQKTRRNNVNSFSNYNNSFINLSRSNNCGFNKREWDTKKCRKSKRRNRKSTGRRKSNISRIRGANK